MPRPMKRARFFHGYPVHMGYNVTVLDKSGKYATVYMNHDRPAQAIYQAVACNHQHQVEWDEYAAFTNTIERKHFSSTASRAAQTRGPPSSNNSPRCTASNTCVVSARLYNRCLWT